MNLFGPKKKTRPSKDQVVKTALDHVEGCQCEADTHTIRAWAKGYLVTIIVAVDESTSRS